ncbi:MAG: hydrogenase maturation protease, partial [Phycisphaerae bacterium]
GTAGLSLASVIEHRQRVVVADAVEAGLEPGAVLRLTPAQLGSCATRALSLHQVHLLDALDETRLLGTSPAQVVVIAVQIGDVSTGIGLTPAVERSVQPAVELVLQELALGGCDVRVGPAQACDSVSFAPSAGSVSLEGAPWN